MPNMKDLMQSTYHKACNPSPEIAAGPSAEVQSFAFEQGILKPEAKKALIHWCNFDAAMSL
jgi:hypothetical protein